MGFFAYMNSRISAKETSTHGLASIADVSKSQSTSSGRPLTASLEPKQSILKVCNGKLRFEMRPQKTGLNSGTGRANATQVTAASIPQWSLNSEQCKAWMWAFVTDYHGQNPETIWPQFKDFVGEGSYMFLRSRDKWQRCLLGAVNITKVVHCSG